jgi:molecular chaperone GrpE
VDETPAAEEETTARQVLESPEQAMVRLESQLAEMQDRHLRIAAEYENFRKRTARERTELWTRAQADVVAGILDVLDDFGRVLDVDQSQASTGDVIKGVELVERKLIRDLEAAGLERVGDVGERFDPNHHEAIGSVPAESEEHDHTVGIVLQLGYKFGGALLRPARVQVRMWQGDGGAAG